MLVRCVGSAALVLCANVPAHAQAGNAANAAFRACDGQAFLALGIARNYLMSDRNRSLVMPHVEASKAARAMAEDLFDRVDRGEIRHPGQFAADTLFDCAGALNLSVGASKEHAALCFTRTDVPLLLHVERAKATVQHQAIATVSGKLTQRTLYPMSLIQQVAEAVYRPEKVPDVQQLMGAVAWGCINSRNNR
jgi:hypothetical protein